MCRVFDVASADDYSFRLKNKALKIVLVVVTAHFNELPDEIPRENVVRLCCESFRDYGSDSEEQPLILEALLVIAACYQVRGCGAVVLEVMEQCGVIDAFKEKESEEGFREFEEAHGVQPLFPRDFNDEVV
jgi:hypothetical protein